MLRTSRGINWEVAVVALVSAGEVLFSAQTPAEAGSEAAQSRPAAAGTAVLGDLALQAALSSERSDGVLAR